MVRQRHRRGNFERKEVDIKKVAINKENKIMLKDWNHDLVQQLSEISDSIWRMEQYKKASGGCEHCLAMWEKLEADYENHVTMLRDEIIRHVKENRFD